MKRRHPILLGSALALVATSPALAADFEIKGLDVGPTPRAAGGPGWDKDEVAIAPGDSVTWTFAGTIQPHNVASSSPNWPVAVKTPYDNPTTTVKFDAPGRYDFICDVHANTMYGTVVVGEPPPPPLSQQAYDNDTPELTAFENNVGLDTTKPALRSVRVKRSGKAAKVSFRVSEAAEVTVRLKRGKKVVKTKRVAASGRGQVTLGAKALRAGRYRVELTAEDLAGNRSARKSAGVRLG